MRECPTAAGVRHAPAQRKAPNCLQTFEAQSLLAEAVSYQAHMETQDAIRLCACARPAPPPHIVFALEGFSATQLSVTHASLLHCMHARMQVPADFVERHVYPPYRDPRAGGAHAHSKQHAGLCAQAHARGAQVDRGAAQPCAHHTAPTPSSTVCANRASCVLCCVSCRCEQQRIAAPVRCSAFPHACLLV